MFNISLRRQITDQHTVDFRIKDSFLCIANDAQQNFDDNLADFLFGLRQLSNQLFKNVE